MPKFETSKKIVVPVQKITVGTPLYIHVKDALREGKRVKQAGESEEAAKTRTPARLLRIINLQSGMECDIVCPAVLASILEEEIGDYVGEDYEVLKHDKEEGKQYYKYTVNAVSVTYEPGEIDPRTGEIVPEESDGETENEDTAAKAGTSRRGRRGAQAAA